MFKRLRRAGQTERPWGRSLSDFGRLMPPERLLIEACRKGQECKLAEARPARPTENNSVRAGLVRFLALGGDDKIAVHEAGVRLTGAWVSDQLDLSSCSVSVPLLLENCRFSDEVAARDARLSLLSLSGSCVPGFAADRVKILGDLILRDRFLSRGEVCLAGAEIGGDLSCSNGTFIRTLGPPNGKPSRAINGQSLRIQGSVYLRAGFRAQGEVTLNGAELRGSLNCNGGTFVNRRRFALTADGIRVGQYVLLSDGFGAHGEVWLSGAEIRENLRVENACIKNPTGRALTVQRIRVDGVFVLRRVRCFGSMSLAFAKIGGLLDDEDSWPPRGLKLDGFCYDRIVVGATTAAARIAWLEKQKKRFLTTDFRPQPWEQLVSVLRAMGHQNQAITVAMAKQNALRRAGKIGARHSRRHWRKILQSRAGLTVWKRSARPFWWIADGTANLAHWLYGKLAGYGYRPARIIWLMMAIWLAVGFVVERAHTEGLVVAAARPDEKLHPANAGPPTGQDSPRTPIFRPFWYSADLVLPVDLGQAQGWTAASPGPSGNGIPSAAIQSLVLTITLAGWFLSLLLVAVVGNLVKKD